MPLIKTFCHRSGHFLTGFPIDIRRYESVGKYRVLVAIHRLSVTSSYCVQLGDQTKPWFLKLWHVYHYWYAKLCLLKCCL